MRFDAPEYVDAWQHEGRWPLIHQAITAAALDNTRPGEHVLDLGASTGLLARRMADEGRQAYAIERPGKAVLLGIDLGVFERVGLFEVNITPKTVDLAADWIGRHKITTVLARRIFPELHDALGEDGLKRFARLLKGNGVEQIILEGRLPSITSKHALMEADREVDLLTASGAWNVQRGAAEGQAHIRIMA